MKDNAINTFYVIGFAFALVLLAAIILVGFMSIAYSEPGTIYTLGASLFVLPTNKSSLLDALDETGGFTINLKPEQFPSPRFAVALGSGFDRVKTPRLSTMPATAAESLCRKAGRAAYREKVDGVGAWKDSDGIVHVEGVRFYSNRASAMEVARKEDQDAIFDFRTGDVLYV